MTNKTAKTADLHAIERFENLEETNWGVVRYYDNHDHIWLLVSDGGEVYWVDGAEVTNDAIDDYYAARDALNNLRADATYEGYYLAQEQRSAAYTNLCGSMPAPSEDDVPPEVVAKAQNDRGVYAALYWVSEDEQGTLEMEGDYLPLTPAERQELEAAALDELLNEGRTLSEQDAIRRGTFVWAPEPAATV